MTTLKTTLPVPRKDSLQFPVVAKLFFGVRQATTANASAVWQATGKINASENLTGKLPFQWLFMTPNEK